MPLFDDFLFDGSGAPVVTPPSPAPTGYLGRYQVGQVVPLEVAPVDIGGYPTEPDAAPWALIADPDGHSVESLEMALGADAEHFAIGFRVGIEHPWGTYQVTYTYARAGVSHTADGSFEVIPGGDPGGAVISLCGYARPEARYVVAQLDSGRLVQGKNPRI